MNKLYWRNPSDNFAPAPAGMQLGKLVYFDETLEEFVLCTSDSEPAIAISARVKGETGLRLVWEGAASVLSSQLSGASVGDNVYQGADGQVSLDSSSGRLIGRVGDFDGDFTILQISGFGLVVGGGSPPDPPDPPDPSEPVIFKVTPYQSYDELTVAFLSEGGSSPGEVSIDWGDGTPIEEVGSVTGIHITSHVYGTQDTFTVKIWQTGGILAVAGNIGEPPEQDKLVEEIVSWGAGPKWYVFSCQNLVSVPDHGPPVDNWHSLFTGCSRLNDQNLESWDSSHVTNLQQTFEACSALNVNLGTWSVSNVENMRLTFSHAQSFYGHGLGNWVVSNVTDMEGMFRGALAFNGAIGDWDVSSVVNMRRMFDTATSFNVDISGWEPLSCTDMSFMFKQALLFNADISGWDVTTVSLMEGMFQYAEAFNQDLSGWCVEYPTVPPTDFGDGASAWVLPRPNWGAACD